MPLSKRYHMSRLSEYWQRVHDHELKQLEVVKLSGGLLTKDQRILSMASLSPALFYAKSLHAVREPAQRNSLEKPAVARENSAQNRGDASDSPEEFDDADDGKVPDDEAGPVDYEGRRIRNPSAVDGKRDTQRTTMVETAASKDLREMLKKDTDEGDETFLRYICDNIFFYGMQSTPKVSPFGIRPKLDKHGRTVVSDNGHPVTTLTKPADIGRSDLVRYLLQTSPLLRAAFSSIADQVNGHNEKALVFISNPRQ